jgi:hypothetical protein
MGWKKRKSKQRNFIGHVAVWRLREYDGSKLAFAFASFNPSVLVI